MDYLRRLWFWLFLPILIHLNNMGVFFLLSSWLKYTQGREGLETLDVASTCVQVSIQLWTFWETEYLAKIAVKSKKWVCILIRLNLWLNFFHLCALTALWCTCYFSTILSGHRWCKWGYGHSKQWHLGRDCSHC